MLWLLVGVGGAIGSLLRFFLQTRLQAAHGGTFPVGTLAVNVIGSAFIGLLAGWLESLHTGGAHPLHAQLRSFLMVGILGGFTTFSSFGLEAVTLVRLGEAGLAITYILLTNVLGIGAAFGGFGAARALASRLGA